MVVLLIYVDDLRINGTSLVLVQNTKNTLQGAFKIKDLGELMFFLANEFARNFPGIVMR